MPRQMSSTITSRKYIPPLPRREPSPRPAFDSIEAGIRNHYHCLVAGIEKPDGTLHVPDAHIPLEEGDVIWLVGEHKDLDVVMTLE